MKHTSFRTVPVMAVVFVVVFLFGSAARGEVFKVDAVIENGSVYVAARLGAFQEMVAYELRDSYGVAGRIVISRLTATHAIGRITDGYRIENGRSYDFVPVNDSDISSEQRGGKIRKRGPSEMSTSNPEPEPAKTTIPTAKEKKESSRRSTEKPEKTIKKESRKRTEKAESSKDEKSVKTEKTQDTPRRKSSPPQAEKKPAVKAAKEVNRPNNKKKDPSSMNDMVSIHGTEGVTLIPNARTLPRHGARAMYSWRNEKRNLDTGPFLLGGGEYWEDNKLTGHAFSYSYGLTNRLEMTLRYEKDSESVLGRAVFYLPPYQESSSHYDISANEKDASLKYSWPLNKDKQIRASVLARYEHTEYKPSYLTSETLTDNLFAAVAVDYPIGGHGAFITLSYGHDDAGDNNDRMMAAAIQAPIGKRFAGGLEIYKKENKSEADWIEFDNDKGWTASLQYILNEQFSLAASYLNEQPGMLKNSYIVGDKKTWWLSLLYHPIRWRGDSN